MTKEKLGEIRINRRTLRIGHQVYPLANISRVQTLREAWRGRRATWYPIWQIAVVGLLNLANRAALATGITPADDLP